MSKCRATLHETTMSCNLCLKSWDINDPKGARCTEYMSKGVSGGIKNHGNNGGGNYTKRKMRK